MTETEKEIADKKAKDEKMEVEAKAKHEAEKSVA